MHDLTYLVKLLYKTVYLSDGGATTQSNTLASRSVKQAWLSTLLGSHGVNDCFDALERVIADVKILD